ncbi:hypothetical protein BAE44_0017456 [Dichanthelium oligosanthes]|uniref:Exocyst subunit Exo70 family protein n=1 Tax=Dichanthelium oligosanthes TaxID=888268 RepID=A0A1E5V8N7_9POAL|nr:hypothetical protein BAE44_0017456 [Dichanthelium oligosanthes]
MSARIKTIIAEARLDSGGGYDNSSGGGSSPASPWATESDGSSSADEFCPQDLSEFRHHASPLSSVRGDDFDRDYIRHVSVASLRALDDIDIHKHQQRMLLLLPDFAAPANTAARAEALSHWLSGFDVGWVLDMDAPGSSGGDESAFPRRELGRRVSAWAQALGTMERVFRLRHHEELTPAPAAALGELAVASAGAMLKLVNAVAALGSSPSKLLAALDLYAPLSETYPALARLFSLGPSHPVPAAAEAALAELVDAARRSGRDLWAFIRSNYPWQMPQGGEVHPCVGFWMGYFRCMLRSRVALHFVLGNEDGESPATGATEGSHRLVAELISCLEAVLEENATALAFPGLRQVFMLNNTHAITGRAVGSDLQRFLPSEWLRVREERMEDHIKGYMDASWAPVLSRLDCGGRAKQPARRRSPLSAFYAAFEGECSAQRCWKVPSPALRGVLRKTVSEYVVPAYRRYLEDNPEVEAGPGRTVEELEQQLSELFEG